MTLNQLKEGESCYIKDINASESFKQRLYELGFLKNSKVEILNKAPFEGPIVVELKGCFISMRLNDASKIEIVRN